MLDMLNQRDLDRKNEQKREFSLPQSPVVNLPHPEVVYRQNGLAQSIVDLRFAIEMIAMQAGIKETDVLTLLVNHMKRSSNGQR